MLSKSFFYLGLILSFILICGCSTNSSDYKSSSNNLTFKIKNDTIEFDGDTSLIYTLHVQIGEIKSYEKEIKANNRIPILDLIRNDGSSLIDVAVYLSENNGSIPIRLKFDNSIDTTFAFHVEPVESTQYKAIIQQGVCAKLSNYAEDSSMESDIIKWLYQNYGKSVNDSIISVIRLYLKELNRTQFNEYVSNDMMPVVPSFKGIEYRVSSDMVADHYYLFACSEEKQVDEFVAEMVSLKFDGAYQSLSNSMSCLRAPSTSGNVCVLLIGINNDWSYQMAPVGMICIDNVKPYIGNEGGGNSGNNSTQFVFDKHRIRVTSKTESPETTGDVRVSFGKFEGYGYMLSVPFTFTFSGDVQKIIVHTTKNTTETIELEGKTSPYHRTIRVGLNTGDNYIPIDAIDACGNKSTYDLSISTQRIERNPVIENNIYR